jgi:hypothetical protein
MTSEERQKILDEIVNSFNTEWQVLGLKLITYIQACIDRGTDIVIAVTKAFKVYGVSQYMLKSTTQGMVKATLAVLDIPQTKSFAVLSNKGLTSKVLANSYDKNGRRFSTRIHGASVEMRNTITSTIKKSIKDSKTIKQAAEKLFDGYGYGQKINTVDIAKDIRKLAQMKIDGVKFDDQTIKELKSINFRISRLKTNPLRASYKQLLDTIEKGTAKAVSKNLYVAVQEKSRYQALMISRTEVARAYGQAFESRSVLDPDVGGIRFALSQAHKQFDICDVHTNFDFGYGKGVYPISKLPNYPFHPHCMCRMLEVFRDELPRNVKLSDKQINENMKKYLDSLSDGRKAKLLSIDGMEQYNKNGNWDSLRNYPEYRAATVNVKKSEFQQVKK